MQGKIIIIFLCVCLALLTGKQSKCFAQIVQFTHVREQRDADIQGYPNKMNSKTQKSDHLKSRWDDNMWDYPIATAKDYPRVTKNRREKRSYLGLRRTYPDYIGIRAYPGYIKIEEPNSGTQNDLEHMVHLPSKRYYLQLLKSHYLRVMRK